MPETMIDQLINQLKPVFPQFREEEDGLKNVIEHVKNEFETQHGIPGSATAANLLPLCVDFLLDSQYVANHFNHIQNQGQNTQNAKHNRKQNDQLKLGNFYRKAQGQFSTDSSSSDSSSLDSSSSNSSTSSNEEQPKQMKFDYERRSLPSSSSASYTSSSSSSSEDSDLVFLHEAKSANNKPVAKKMTSVENYNKNPTVTTGMKIPINSSSSSTSSASSESSVPNTQSQKAKPARKHQNFSVKIPVVNTNYVPGVNTISKHSQQKYNDVVFVGRSYNHQQMGIDSNKKLKTAMSQTHTISNTRENLVNNMHAKSAANYPNNFPDSNKNQIQEKKGNSESSEALMKVLSVIPDVDLDFVHNLVLKDPGQSPDIIANNVIEQLFEMPYPKNAKKELPKKVDDPKDIDYYDVKNLESVSTVYQMQCLNLLRLKFPKVSSKDIDMAMKANKHRYAATVKYLQSAISTGRHFHPTMKERTIKFIKTRRPKQIMPDILDPELQKESDVVEEREKHSTSTFSAFQEPTNDQEDHSMMECGCCYGDAHVGSMVQCLEGHLFCRECLRSYAKEAIFGGGKTQLSCMTADCNSTFPLSQLEKSLDDKMLEKYHERLQDESIKLAELPDLVRCPSCDFAAELPPNDKVFRCQNEQCQKETCRYCKEEWKDHFGIPCSELEKNDAKKIRVSYEEKMSMAKIRTCSKCKIEFTKHDGCNKMTCRCGATMCYICRTPKISYQHFCNHPRSPGKGCKKCKHCFLWSNPDEDDERAIKELKKEALQESEKLNTAGPSIPIGTKRQLVIGTPDDINLSKKKKRARKTI